MFTLAPKWVSERDRRSHTLPIRLYSDVTNTSRAAFPTQMSSSLTDFETPSEQNTHLIAAKAREWLGIIAARACRLGVLGDCYCWHASVYDWLGRGLETFGGLVSVRQYLFYPDSMYSGGMGGESEVTNSHKKKARMRRVMGLGRHDVEDSVISQREMAQ